MKKVLIISTNAIGDAYLSASAIDTLKNIYKEIKIDFVVNISSGFFIKELDINEFFFIKQKSIAEVFGIISRIRKCKYDFVFTFFPGLVNTIVFKSCNAEVKSGFINFRKISNWYNISQKLYVSGRNSQDLFWYPEMNYLDRIKIVLSGAGITIKNIRKITFPNLLCGFEKDDSVLLHFSSRTQERMLNYELVEKLISYLCNELNLKTNVIGTEKELSGLHIHENKLTLIPSPDLKLLIELMLKCKVFIGVDSFPIHLADAYKIKTIGIFVSTNPVSVLQNRENKYILRKDTFEKIELKDIIDMLKNIKLNDE